MSEFQPVQPQKTNGMAIAGFVVALVCCSPLGIIFSAIGLNQIEKDPAQGGKGLAIAGLIIGVVGLIGSLILWAFWGTLFGAAIDSYDYGY
jgi:peptidyl-prolyl cis-trans isomerase B (cyclophilin B)